VIVAHCPQAGAGQFGDLAGAPGHGITPHRAVTAWSTATGASDADHVKQILSVPLRHGLS
jgi:hypothetical protein